MSDLARKLTVFAVIAAVLAGLAYVYVSRRAVDGGPPGMAGPAAGGARAAAGGAPGAGGRPGGGGGFGGQPVSVVAVDAALVELAVEVEALGTARANEAVDITAKTANLVTAVRFTEGQRVNRGQVLVELDGAQARADLAAAEAALSESRSQFNRSKDLVTQAALSAAQLEQIEATLKGNEARVASAAARVADTVIRAPFSGRVGLRRVSVGSLVSPGTVITTLDDTSTMKLDFDVPETFLSVVTPGLPIRATSVAYPGREFTGRVQSVDSRVDPVARAVTIRAALPNDDGVLKPGMFMTVRLTREPQPAVVIAEQALVPERGKVFVFVVDKGIAQKREVTTGRRRPGEVEIVAGIAPGDRVVVEGTQKIREGAPVTEVPAPGAIAGQPQQAAQ